MQNYAVDTARSAWDAVASDWRTDGKPHSFFRRFLTRQDLGDQALDVGCGTGIYITPLLVRHFTVTAVDFSKTMLELARQRVEELNCQSYVRLIHSEMHVLPVADASIDLALCFGVLHFNDWSGVVSGFAEITRTLRPGGHFLLQVRSINDREREREAMTPTPGGYIARECTGPMHDVPMHYFTDTALIELGASHGLEVIEGPMEGPPQDGVDDDPRRRWWVAYRKL